VDLLRGRAGGWRRHRREHEGQVAKTIAINPSWYWPDDIPRLLGVPPMRAERLLIERWARRRADGLALVDVGRTGEALTYAELQQRVRGVAGALAGRVAPGARVAICDARGSAGVIALLGALAAGTRPALLASATALQEALALQDGAPPQLAIGCAGAPPSDLSLPAIALSELLGAAAQADAAPAGTSSDVHAPVLDLPSGQGLFAAHSHYSLVAGALSLAAFLAAEGPQSWLSAIELSRWEGIYSVFAALYSGGTAVVCDARQVGDEAAAAIADHNVAYALLPFDALGDLSRGRPRRLADAIKRNLTALLVSVQEPFSAGERRKARKTLDIPILTIYGLPECGPILASHPSWYVDESVGIPLTNVEVQPANPRTGEPLDTNWELLDYATMVVRTPLVMSTYEGSAAGDQALAERLEDGWFRTWTNASFDANGMMYLVEGSRR